MPLGFGVPFTAGKKKKVTQFTTLMITPLGQSKAGSIANQDKFRFLDSLAELSPAQVIDVAREANLHVATATRIAQEFVDGKMARIADSDDE